jgi:DNA-directed RNA polymerase specialized sigma24 family protein
MTRLVEISVAEELVAQARAGDEAAQAAIYAAVAPATFTLIRRLVGQRALSEDLFQDTMMTFYERLPQFRHEAPLGAWLRQIAISRCLMYLRSPWKRARLHLDPDDYAAAMQCAAPRPTRASSSIWSAPWRRWRPPHAWWCGCTRWRATRTRRSPARSAAR